jgi:aquaporin Z
MSADQTARTESAGPAPARPLRLGEGYGLSARIAAEAAGAFLLFFGAMGIGMFNPQGGFAVPFGFGLAVVAGMLAFGHISGGHFNPAITLGSALAGRTRWKSVLPYVVAQLAGTSLAAVVLWVVMRSHPVGSQAAQVFSSVANKYASGEELGFGLAGVFLAETIATAILVAVYLGATSSRERLRGAPYAVGFAFAVLSAVLIPISNAGMNPARSTAGVYFAEPAALSELWLFWVAPLLGAVIAGLLYRSAEMVPSAKAVAEATAAAPEEAVQEQAPVGSAPSAADSQGTVRAAAPSAASSGPAVDGTPEAPQDDRGADEARDFFDGEAGRKRDQGK